MANPKKPAKKATKATHKPAAKKTAAKKTPAKKTAAKKTPAKKTAAKKTAAKKTAAKKTASKKTAAKATATKATAKKTATKATAKKTATKTTATKTTTKKTASRAAPAKKPARKSASSGPAAEAFADPGLHLSVVNRLLESGALDPETLEAALTGIDADADEADRVAEALQRVQRVPLAADAVTGITTLDFSGGNDIYMLIERVLDIDTGGEENYYELRSLAGIERLAALTKLSLVGHGYRASDLDLTPLTGHPALTSVHLTGHCTHAAALESLPRLAQLAASVRDVDDPKVLKRLAARGVLVRDS